MLVSIKVRSKKGLGFRTRFRVSDKGKGVRQGFTDSLLPVALSLVEFRLRQVSVLSSVRACKPSSVTKVSHRFRVFNFLQCSASRHSPVSPVKSC